MSRVRILLADDHSLVLEAFRKLLEPEHDVVGTATDGHALMASAQRLKPDIVVVDIGMPLLNGLDAARQLKLHMPGVKLIFLTMAKDPELAREAMELGASAYLLKSSAASELTTAIREALCGRKYVTPFIRRELEKAFIEDPTPKKTRNELTLRQREVLQLLAEGRPMKEVADILHTSERTVAFHKYRMMARLHLKSSAELIRYAAKLHLVDQ